MFSTTTHRSTVRAHHLVTKNKYKFLPEYDTLKIQICASAAEFVEVRS